MSKLRVGVIGYGYWGPNMARNIAECAQTQLVAVADLNKDCLSLAQRRHPGIDCFSDPYKLIGADVDAVVIATPVSTHFELARDALQRGKHVLAEKPLTTSVETCRVLVELAHAKDLILFVDHTLAYSGAVRKIRDLVKTELGHLYYYDAVRVNLGLFQHDVNVLWDLAVHDLSIMEYVIGQTPVAVSATGMAHVAGQPVNTAFLTCFFENDLIAHVHANWLSPAKIRRCLVGGEKRLIVYDDLEPSEKIKVYDSGVITTPATSGVQQMLVGYRTGDMWAPRLDTTEPLAMEIQHFAECILHRQRPETDGVAGLRVVAVLEAANKSLKLRGAPVEISGLDDLAPSRF